MLKGLKMVGFEVALWALALICAFLATSSFYHFYQMCSGSSAGGAFSLSILALLISVLSVGLWHFMKHSFPARKGTRIMVFLSGWVLVWVALMVYYFPIQERNNFGGCPAWLVST